MSRSFSACVFPLMIVFIAVSATALRADPHFYQRGVAICVGVNSTSPALAYAERDAGQIADLLNTEFGFDTVTLLGREATKSAIEEKVREVCGRGGAHGGPLAERDVLIFYFAGHGTFIETDPRNGPDRVGFLLPHDAELSIHERHPDKLPLWRAYCIEMRPLAELLSTSKAQHVVIIVDACCSGLIGSTRGNLFDRPDLQWLAKGRSRVVLTAAGDVDAALEDPGRKRGHFTGAILDVLKAASMRQDALSALDVFDAVREDVARNPGANGMKPQLTYLGERDGEFVFFPKRIPEEEINLLFMDPGGNHVASDVIRRAFDRTARRSTMQDVLDAFSTPDYRFSTTPLELDAEWKRRLARFEENAAASDEFALAALHYCYSRGLGVDRNAVPDNDRRAYEFARQAAALDSPAGRHVLARCYLSGIGVPANPQAARAMIDEAAAAGFPVSLYSKARFLLDRPPAEVTAELAQQADELFARAAEGGVIAALVDRSALRQGAMPQFPADYATAIEFLEQAAARGSAHAKTTLHDVYSRGVGGRKKDLNLARKYLEEAAAMGFVEAQNNLANELFQLSGTDYRLGLRKDVRKAFEWADLAARQGDRASLFLLGNICEYGGEGFPPDFARAKEFIERASDMNFGPAHTKLALWYAEGKVLAPDGKKSVQYARRAAATGDAPGQILLASLIQDGHAETVPRHEMFHWALLAAEQGLPKGVEKVRELWRKVQLGTEKSAWNAYMKAFPGESERFRARAGSR